MAVIQASRTARFLSESDTMVSAAQLEGLLDDLEGIAGLPPEAVVDEVVHATGDVVVDLARRYAPVETGELVGSIRATHGPGYSRVTAAAPHAAAVEFGTWSYNEHDPKSGTYEIRPVRAKALRFETAGGETVFAQKVDHPGVEAQPFMRPAIGEVTEQFTEALAEQGIRLIVEGPGP